jgi:hypothetical protein
MNADEVRDLVAETRRQQNLPPRVEDAGALRRIAELVSLVGSWEGATGPEVRDQPVVAVVQRRNGAGTRESRAAIVRSSKARLSQAGMIRSTAGTSAQLRPTHPKPGLDFS